MGGVVQLISCACGTTFEWTAAQQAAAARFRLPAPKHCTRCSDALRQQPLPQGIGRMRSTRGRHPGARRKKPVARPAAELIACERCGTEFVWTLAQQATFARRGFLRPRKCRRCSERQKQLAQRARRPVQVVQGGLPSLGKRS